MFRKGIFLKGVGVLCVIAALGALAFSVRNASVRGPIVCAGCNVILINIDLLRQDHMGLYGYRRSTTPNMDRFFLGRVRFTNAIAPSPVTLASAMSLFTGVYPVRHGLFYWDMPLQPPLRLDIKTLPEILQLYGYRTYGFFRATPSHSPQLGFSRGLDRYFAMNGLEDLETVVELLQSRKRERFFLYLFDNSAHDPYLADAPYDTMFTDKNYQGDIIGNRDAFLDALHESQRGEGGMPADFLASEAFYWSRVDPNDPKDREYLLGIYDGIIRSVDDAFAKLMARLERAGLLEKTIVIVTSAHGEQFFEHDDFGHGSLYDEELRVPLLIRMPMPARRTVRAQVSLVDLMPTILEIVGAAPPEAVDGSSLKPLIEQPDAEERERAVFADFGQKKAVRTPEWKLIEYSFETTRYMLYNLKEDSGETQNLAGTGIGVERVLRAALDVYKVLASTTPIEIDTSRYPFPGYQP